MTPGALFFCTPGLVRDAHDFAPQAVEKGAAALVVQRELDVDVPQVLVEDVRLAVSYIAAAFYGHPAERLQLIGITGTKGKTTSSFLVKSILEEAGRKTGLIGTVCSMIGEEVDSGQPDHPGSHRDPAAAAPHGGRGLRVCGDGGFGARAGHAPAGGHALRRGRVHQFFTGSPGLFPGHGRIL